MRNEDVLAVLKQVENVAALAGLVGRIDREELHFVMNFDLDGGRSQQVFVRVTGMTPDDKQIVTLFSPACVVKKGFLSGISKEQALELLRMNEDCYFTRFGIWEHEKETMIVASSDLLLETLDPDELKNHAYYAAYAADMYEAKHGVDAF